MNKREGGPVFLLLARRMSSAESRVHLCVAVKAVAARFLIASSG